MVISFTVFQRLIFHTKRLYCKVLKNYCIVYTGRFCFVKKEAKTKFLEPIMLQYWSTYIPVSLSVSSSFIICGLLEGVGLVTVAVVALIVVVVVVVVMLGVTPIAKENDNKFTKNQYICMYNIHTTVNWFLVRRFLILIVKLEI